MSELGKKNFALKLLFFFFKMSSRNALFKNFELCTHIFILKEEGKRLLRNVLAKPEKKALKKGL